MNGDSTKAYEGPAALIHDDRTFVVQAEVYRSEAPSPKIVGSLVHIPPPPDWTVEAYSDGHLPGVRLFDPEPMLIRFLDGHEGSMFVTDGCVATAGDPASSTT
ncbi:hypothetical protein [Actinomadura sp. HBU206391]|uniref:hypothetical protein n=1 Tax=Actinomadura sp. HBU206391 TaxID=2731692 RepID=UPI00164EE004|nr:hypothetical protein [Actinomadura sp. HBU206391]MBC6460282.1 hypothetical protein [Actinomadura sp. HBU206391]